MSRHRVALVVVAGALVVVVVALLLARGGDDGATPSGADPEPTASAPPVVSDVAWCAGWMHVVAVQGQYVADPGPASSATVIEAVEALRALGVPESLDPSGYTELNAVLDDIQASVDASFTPSVAPSEPADVAPEGEDDEHGHEEHGDEEHGHDAGDAPFGAWLAEHCS
ncbi:hypothetical protein [Nocardioides antri]|uniref:Uncharacterized protein n=1 Tax=Nocardioides antri TaxID=2607659 RepID=A0A5B1M1X9_9ACTN|nr:hypothetical protein [Nocardioides antri]KAA1425817.1 hypothetical protein F0U47_15805 [Nocardioides antri]